MLSSQEGGLIGLPLRLSNEGLLRPRVARAQEINRPPSHPSDRVASASKKDGLAVPLPSFRACSLHASKGGLVDPRMRASNEHILIVRVPRAGGRPGSPSPPPPSPLVLFQGWGLIDLPLRASNEGLPRPRVARAQKIIRLHPILPYSTFEFEHGILQPTPMEKRQRPLRTAASHDGLTIRSTKHDLI